MEYTLHQLEVYRKVAELKSVTRASEALYLTQPAVSIQLKKLQLESDLASIQKTLSNSKSLYRMGY